MADTRHRRADDTAWTWDVDEEMARRLKHAHDVAQWYEATAHIRPLRRSGGDRGRPS